MRTLAALALVLLCFTCRAATVADALIVERLRVDPSRATGAQLIDAAADRFAEYYPLADSRLDVKRLDHAFHNYASGVLRRQRARLFDAIIRNWRKWWGPDSPPGGILQEDRAYGRG
jgi:hypothetical protein